MAHVQEVLVDRYELLEVLGRGGMGVVYRARDRVLDRTVAVKLLPLDRAEDPTLVARFEREALAVAALSHRNIVAVFDAGADQGTRFIVMEYLGGQSLSQLLHDRGALEVGEAVEIAGHVAAALAAAHRAGIVHRDIKPANVMLDLHGQVKVLDFGIARLASGASLTQTAMVLGSAPYLAPELCRGDPADARSDIYALGCVLYALLTGRPPFTGDMPAAVVHQQISAVARPPAELNPRVPPALSALTLAMLAKDPDRRPQHAAGLVRSLPAALAAAPEDAPTTRLYADAVRVVPVHSHDSAPGRIVEEPTEVMSGPTRSMPSGPESAGRRAAHRAIALVALATVVAALVALFALDGSSGPGHESAAKHLRETTTNAVTKQVATTTQTRATASVADTRTDTTASTLSSTTATAPAPGTVAAAVVALGSLIGDDVKDATISTGAANAIDADAQQISAAATAGQSAPVLAGLVKLGTDISNFTRQGLISASALPALSAAVSTLTTNLERSAGAAGTQTTAGPGTRPGGPAAGGWPPGQAQKPGFGHHHG